jgi:hypothetical protein
MLQGGKIFLFWQDEIEIVTKGSRFIANDTFVDFNCPLDEA